MMYAKLAIAAVCLAVLGGLYAVIHHKGYVAGQAEREGYYQPLMKAAEVARDKANARADRAEKAAGEISAQSERDHAVLAKTLADHVTAANDRIAGILRQHPRSRGYQVPAVPGTAGKPQGTSASDERDQRFSGQLSAVGGRCEHDAAEVAEFQHWYAQQRANALTTQVQP